MGSIYWLCISYLVVLVDYDVVYISNIRPYISVQVNHHFKIILDANDHVNLSLRSFTNLSSLRTQLHNINMSIMFRSATFSFNTTRLNRRDSFVAHRFVNESLPRPGALSRRIAFATVFRSISLNAKSFLEGFHASGGLYHLETRPLSPIK